jgi:hypothetical protein
MKNSLLDAFNPLFSVLSQTYYVVKPTLESIQFVQEIQREIDIEKESQKTEFEKKFAELTENHTLPTEQQVQIFLRTYLPEVNLSIDFEDFFEGLRTLGNRVFEVSYDVKIMERQLHQKDQLITSLEENLSDQKMIQEHDKKLLIK